MSLYWPEVWQHHRIGEYTANELQVEIYPNLNSTVGRIPIIFCHGFSLLAQPSRIVTGAPYWRTLGMLAHVTGCPVVAADFAGNAWNNSTARTLFGTLRTWLAANIGCRGDKFFAVGESMGSLGALFQAWTNPVACVGYWVRAPIVAMQTFHDVNVVFQGNMEAAYGNLAGLVAAYPTVDPAQNSGSLVTFGERGRIDWTDQDELISPDLPKAYAAAVGAIGVQSHGDHAANLDTPDEVVAEWARSVIDAAA